MPFDPTHSELKRPVLYCLVFAIAVGVLWAFPVFWYRGAGKEAHLFWLAEQTKVPGWVFKDIPVAKSAEALLVADHTLNGEFTSEDGFRMVRVFSAKHYGGNEKAVYLLVHPPDLCWVMAGWKNESLEPMYLDCSVEGTTIRYERRLFAIGERKELVYFGALVDGKPLSYRLNQFLNWKGSGSDWWRVAQDRSGKMWDSFVHRTAFGGPQQFLRISTPVVGDDLAEADERLRSFLPQWLVVVDYQKEREAWLRAKPAR